MTDPNEMLNGSVFPRKNLPTFYHQFICRKSASEKKKSTDSSRFMGPLSSHKHAMNLKTAAISFDLLFRTLFFFIRMQTTSHENIQFKYLMRAENALGGKEIYDI